MTVFVDPALLIPALEVTFALAAAALALRNRQAQPVTLLILAGAAIFSALLAALHAGWIARLFPALPETLPAALAPLGLLLLAIFICSASLSFLRSERALWYLLPAAALVAALLTALDQGFIRLPDVLWRGDGLELLRVNFVRGAWITASGLLLLAALGWAIAALQRTRQPLHRNRLIYWFPVLALAAAGGGMEFAGNPHPGTGLRLAAIWLAVIVTSSHRLPDLRRFLRRSLSYLALTLLAVAVYAGGFIAIGRFFPPAVPNRDLWVGMIMALLLAVLFNPLLRLVEGLADRLISATSYNTARLVREYSLHISNILELDHLEAAAISLILRALNISSGHLLLVTRGGGSEDEPEYHLASIQPGNGFTPDPITLAPGSPAAAFLASERRPLTQYDLDLLPRFQKADPTEKGWFAGLAMDVYVPIAAQERWIGLFVLGPKVSGDRYFEEDLLLLSTLADQTAVALENARLVKDLVQLNTELRSATEALGRANVELEKLDKAKSDFINVASHELRTPLTLLGGYSQMLLEEQPITGNAAYMQMVQGIVSGTNRLHEIVDSMLEVAKIDNRTLQLDPRPISLASLLGQITSPLEKPIAERRLHFELFALDQLPAIEADPPALEKVFYHVIVNAIKYTPDGGKISVTGRSLPASQSPLGRDSVEVVISDTGIGIDPHNLELVFSKFFQTGEVSLHSTGKTKFKGGGPGLGLSIARGVVEAHAGRIWVESRGHDERTCPGSHFHVLLPVAQSARGNGASADPATIQIDVRPE